MRSFVGSFIVCALGRSATPYGGDLAPSTLALPDLRAAAPNGLTYVICTQGPFPPP